MRVLGNSKREVLERRRIGKYLLLVFLPLLTFSFIAIVLTYRSGRSDVEHAAISLFYLSCLAAGTGICFYWNVKPDLGEFLCVILVPWDTPDMQYNLPKWADKLIYIAIGILAVFMVAMLAYAVFFIGK
jgi:hypothetical protein